MVLKCSIIAVSIFIISEKNCLDLGMTHKNYGNKQGMEKKKYVRTIWNVLHIYMLIKKRK